MIDYHKISAFESQHDCIVGINEEKNIIRVSFVDGDIITLQSCNRGPDTNKWVLDTLSGIEHMVRLKWGELIV